MSRPNALRWIWIVVTSLVVAAAVGTPFFLKADGKELSDAEAGPQLVKSEQQYYVLLAVVEVDPKKEGDSAWDTGGSAPDLYYEIEWQNHTVFESEEKADTLVAKWSNAAIEASDLLGSISIDGSIKAARITAREGDRLRFRVFDSDTLVKDDLVGEWEVDVESLLVGDQRWDRPGGRIVSAVCRVVPFDGVDSEALTK